MEAKVTLTSPLRVMNPIIKIVGNHCNLRCGYCFHHGGDQSIPHPMSDELLERFIAEYLELFPEECVTFIWHGGEPLLRGLAFFRKAVALQEQYQKGQTFVNLVQTNGTLITHEWAEFFKTHKFGVGVSLDGDQISHDLYRKNMSGRGSFDDTLRGFYILREHGIEPGVTQTLTSANISRVERNFSFFADTLGTKSWAMNVSDDVSNDELTQAFKTVIDLWFERDSKDMAIREIENFLCGIYGKMARSCKWNGTCTGYFCLDYDGSIYPCDRSSDPDMSFGNIYRSPLLEVLNGPVRMNYARVANSSPPDCLDCGRCNACHNGCSLQRAGFGRYKYCQTNRAIFSYLEDKVARYANPPIISSPNSEKGEIWV